MFNHLREIRRNDTTSRLWPAWHYLIVAMMPLPIWIIIISVLMRVLGEVSSMETLSTLSSKRSSCIAVLAQHHFHTNSTIAVITSDSDYHRIVELKPTTTHLEDNLIKLLSASTQFSLVTLTAAQGNVCCFDKVTGKKTMDYFVFVGSAEEVVRCVARFSFQTLTNDRSRFVVYLKTSTLDSATVVNETFHLFWRHQHHEVAVLVDNQQEEVKIYTWFPFNDKPVVKIIDRCSGTRLR